MQVTVFGASGKVGRLVVERLINDGHNVTVFVHNTSPFSESPRLKVVRGDVHNAASVQTAINGADAVISTLGSWGTPTKDILTSAMQVIVPTMERQGIARIITVTGSAARAPGDKHSLAERLMHTVFGIVAGKILADGEQHLALLAKSNLRWTSIRAGVMKACTSKPYFLNQKSPRIWETIPRESVAQALVDQLELESFERQAPHIHV